MRRIYPSLPTWETVFSHRDLQGVLGTRTIHCTILNWLSSELLRLHAAARAHPFPFMLTARAHNFLYAQPSLAETISRLQAFENAGADVLFAPGLPDLSAVRAVCAALSKPFNFMAGIVSCR